jgi:hypothetical protein
MLLTIAGAAPDAIAEDYAQSHERLAPLYEVLLQTAPDDQTREIAVRSGECTAELMLDLLDDIRNEYGGFFAYASDAGVSGDDLEHLRERLAGP